MIKIRTIEQKLKNCPLCGGKSEFHIIDYNGTITTRIWYFNIRCKKCLLEQPKAYTLEVMFCKNGNIETSIDERNNAIEDWNRRVNND